MVNGESYALRAARTSGQEYRNENQIQRQEHIFNENSMPQRPKTAFFTPDRQTAARSVFDAFENCEVENYALQDIDKPLTFLTIYDAPFELSDLAIIKRLTPYCDVLNYRRGKHSCAPNIYNGLRHYRVFPTVHGARADEKEDVNIDDDNLSSASMENLPLASAFPPPNQSEKPVQPADSDSSFIDENLPLASVLPPPVQFTLPAKQLTDPSSELPASDPTTQPPPDFDQGRTGKGQAHNHLTEQASAEAKVAKETVKSKNPDFNYQQYGPFNLDDIDSAEFRIEKADLPRLAEALQLPPTFHCQKRTVYAFGKCPAHVGTVT
ncbi:hypothetical protein AWC38_SpisGene1976 [Stylophora pistillata]|uniref:Uncharacterized protein n=1 Tax=Stylophora pistillata TaxID=50429 RepID=A0A2B4SX62_STYPI|nr:hypothetical protein AWC38_SpisGene1976 [Stylophora pistillata]